MTSLFNGATKQNHGDIGYYITVGDCRAGIYAINPVSQAPSTLAWAAAPAAGKGPISTLVAAAGALLKDMGRTYLSSGRTFRKVQLVVAQSAVPGTASTFGVGGDAGGGSGNGTDYYTGYIELGFEGGGTPTRVAHFGR